MENFVTKYIHEYDDPYILCVMHLISEHNEAEMKRMLVDDEYVSSLILKETRLTDFKGAFLDAIIEEILNSKKRMEMMRELDKLSLYFYKNLDLDRLRDTIRYLIERYDFFDLDE